MKGRRIQIFPLLAALMLLCSGCSEEKAYTDAPEPEAPSNVTFVDDLGRDVVVPQAPQRVAVLIGSFADVWCIAGGADTLVAAPNDAWTSFDLGIEEGEVANLGAIKEPSLEKLLGAQPDFVIGSCNTVADIEMMGTLESADIPVAYFDVQNFDDYLRMLAICTTLTGCAENYETYGTALQEQIDAAIARQDGSCPSVLCVRVTGTSAKVKGSQDYLLGEMLADLGCVNIADSNDTLLESLSIEAIIAEDPAYIFIVLQGSDPSDAEDMLEKTLLSNKAWSELTAVQENRVYYLENELYNLKPNDQWGKAYEKLADILFPEM